MLKYLEYKLAQIEKRDERETKFWNEEVSRKGYDPITRGKLQPWEKTNLIKAREAAMKNNLFEAYWELQTKELREQAEADRLAEERLKELEEKAYPYQEE